MSAQIIAFRTPGCPPPRDPPVHLPVKRPKPTKGVPTERELADRLKGVCERIGVSPQFSSPTLPRAQFLQASAVMHRWARDLGLAITVHPQGGAT